MVFADAADIDFVVAVIQNIKSYSTLHITLCRIDTQFWNPLYEPVD